MEIHQPTCYYDEEKFQYFSQLYSLTSFFFKEIGIYVDYGNYSYNYVSARVYTFSGV